MEGIANLGSTCAINSLIQILFRIKKFKEIIMKSNANDGTLTYEFKDLFNAMKSNSIITPNRFINNFYIIFKGVFQKFEQIDICELFLYVIQKLHEETSIPIMIEKISVNIFEEHNYNIAVLNEFKTSKFYDLLQGSYMNTTECSNCGYVYRKFEPFIYVALDIKENLSISELLSQHFISETREKDEWKCNKCNKYCNYNKTSIIWKYPEILFISLNRFKEIIKKNTDYISIDIKLNYHKIYNLQGIGFHHGMLEGGHYNAICKNLDTFYYYDDNNVGIINDISSMLEKSKDCYLLCYDSQ